MAYNGSRAGFRQTQSRTPQFIVVALSIVICILGFNYWYLSGEHSNLRERNLEVQGKYTALLRRRNDMERKNAALRSEITRSEALLKKMEKVGASKNEELLERQKETQGTLERMAKLQGEVESCKGSLAECKETGDHMKHMLSRPNVKPMASTENDDRCKKELFDLKTTILNAVAKFHSVDLAKKIDNEITITENGNKQGETNNLNGNKEKQQTENEKSQGQNVQHGDEPKERMKNELRQHENNRMNTPEKKNDQEVVKNVDSVADKVTDKNQVNTPKENLNSTAKITQKEQLNPNVADKNNPKEEGKVNEGKNKTNDGNAVIDKTFKDGKTTTKGDKDSFKDAKFTAKSDKDSLNMVNKNNAGKEGLNEKVGDLKGKTTRDDKLGDNDNKNEDKGDVKERAGNDQENNKGDNEEDAIDEDDKDKTKNDNERTVLRGGPSFPKINPDKAIDVKERLKDLQIEKPIRLGNLGRKYEGNVDKPVMDREAKIKKLDQKINEINDQNDNAKNL